MNLPNCRKYFQALQVVLLKKFSLFCSSVSLMLSEGIISSDLSRSRVKLLKPLRGGMGLAGMAAAQPLPKAFLHSHTLDL